MDKTINAEKLNRALRLLNEQLIIANAPRTEIVVCGGSALIALSLVARTTQDVDIIALMKNGVPADPDVASDPGCAVFRIYTGTGSRAFPAERYFPELGIQRL